MKFSVSCLSTGVYYISYAFVLITVQNCVHGIHSHSVCICHVTFFFSSFVNSQILDLNPGQIWFAGQITILHTVGINWY